MTTRSAAVLPRSLAFRCITALAALTAFWTPAHADEPPLTVADWSRMIWKDAQSGDASGVQALLQRIPLEHEDASLREIRALADRFSTHATERAASRVARVEELRAELAKHVEAGEMLKALGSAIEWYAVADDKLAVLSDEAVRSLTAEADAKAREHEAARRWLDAQAIFFRLSILYEDQSIGSGEFATLARRLKDDARRVGDRITLLSMFVPKRLHELRNEQLVAQGEDPLPAYNDLAADWREKVAGIDQYMLRRAILRAHASHVDRVPLSKLITGGLRAVRVFATTPDLVDAFPSFKDEGTRNAFIKEVDARLAAVDALAGKDADSFDLTKSIMALLDANDAGLKIPSEAILRTFGDGAVAELDEFSSVIWPDEMNRFRRMTEGRFQGVGIQITLDDGRNLKVVTPLEGTPAQRAGIKPGDLIRKVDGHDTLGLSLLQAVDRITGEGGTTVTLSVEREGAEGLIDFNLTRTDIPIYTVKGWKRNGVHESDWDWFVDPDSRIGYVRLTQFTDDTTAHFDEAVRQMREKGLNALVLDLRFNPGGLLSQSVSMSNRFIDEGVIVTQHDANGELMDIQRARRGAASLADIPVAVLINEGSASASEIVSGAIQDYARDGVLDAVLVGARSFGKGSVQNIYDLGRSKALFKVTERYYHLPKGRLIHRRDGATEWGVQPDYAVDVLPKQVGDALELRQDADLLELDQQGNVTNDATRPDPTRLLTEGLDPQLEAAVLLLKSQVVARTAGHAMLPPAVAPVGGM
ncbi:MAG: S41 family peptidase [Phycisphaerales bacterium]